MLVEHRGRRPDIDPGAWIAPTAVVCGDVRVAAGARILWNAVVTAEDGSVEIGERCVVMEHALIRGRAAHPVVISRDVLIGPHAHVNRRAHRRRGVHRHRGRAVPRRDGR